MSEPAPADVPATPAEPVAPVTTESAPAAEPSAQPAPTEPTIDVAQVAKYLGTTPETLADFTKFTANNGKFDKAFEKMKAAISRPETLQARPQAQTQQQPIQTPQVPQNGSQSVTQQYPEGTYSIEEMAALNYFDRLASADKYANIADDIRSGKVLSGLKDFHITPIKDGRINDAEVRKYLDLYAATKPATPTSATPTAEQQVDYVPVTKITSREEADKIQLQSIQLRAQGLPPHPLEEQAKAWIREYYKNNK